MSVSTDLKQAGDEVGSQADAEEQTSLPFELPLLQRSPHSILWHKVGLEQRATTGKAIEQEIKMKLSFLQKIYKKRRDGSNGGHQVDLDVGLRTLELGLQDRCSQLEEAGRRMAETRDAIANLQLQVEEAERAKADLLKTGDEKKVMHQKSLAFIKNKIDEVQERTRKVGVVKKDEGGRPCSSPGSDDAGGFSKEAPTLGCVQFGFGHLGHLTKMLQELSKGEHGSKLVASRVEVASEAELGLLRGELGLPGSLVSHLANLHSVRVILALTKVDPISRAALLRQTKDQLSEVLAVDGGHHFVQQLMEDVK